MLYVVPPYEVKKGADKGKVKIKVKGTIEELVTSGLWDEADEMYKYEGHGEAYIHGFEDDKEMQALCEVAKEYNRSLPEWESKQEKKKQQEIRKQRKEEVDRMLDVVRKAEDFVDWWNAYYNLQVMFYELVVNWDTKKRFSPRAFTQMLGMTREESRAVYGLMLRDGMLGLDEKFTEQGIKDIRELMEIRMSTEEAHRKTKKKRTKK
jgi:hypothetical protein